MLDVYRGGKKQFPMSPGEARLPGQRQPQTMVAIHSIPSWDLYVVYEGTNPDTGQPIIKAFLNPLVGWIWAGLVVLVFGTFVALVPSLSPATLHCGWPRRHITVAAGAERRPLMTAAFQRLSIFG